MRIFYAKWLDSLFLSCIFGVYYKNKLMKQKISILLMSSMLFFSSHGQNLTTGDKLQKGSIPAKSSSRAVCEFDYIEYANVKNLSTTDVGVLGVQNSSTTVLGLAQWFDAPQAVEIYGAAFLYNGNAGTVTVNIYNSNAAGDVLAQLATVTANYAGTSATALAYGEVEFAQPVVVTGPYYVAIENSSTTTLLRMATNDPDLFSGRGEFLSKGKFGSDWYSLDDLYTDGYDADVYLEPLVSYEITAQINHSVTSPICPNSTDQLTATYSPIINSKFYNKDVLESFLNNTPAPAPTYWTYMNETLENVASVNASYATAGNYPIELMVAYARFFDVDGDVPLCGEVVDGEIVVSALDDATFTYGSSTVCVGGADLTPTITTAGGAFTTTGALIIDAATGVVDVTDSPEGTYTITYTTAGACPNSSTQSLTITSAPSAAFTLSSDEVCGSASNVTATVTGSVGVFSSTTGLEINASTGEVNVAASTPGTYVITNTIAASGSCPAATHNETLEIIAASNAAFAYSATAFCEEGSNPTITISGTAGTFSSTAGLEINATTGDLDIAASTVGTYVITNTVAATGVCPEVTSTETIVINSLPTATASASGATVTVVETTGATYQWINCDDDTEITGATSSTYAPSAPGSFQVVVTANGCSSTSACISVTNVSVSSVSLDNVAIFPNPASDVITIAGLTAAQSTITVLDVNGKVIISQVVTAAQTDLTIANVESGVYFIQVSSETLNGTKRFIKK